MSAEIRHPLSHLKAHFPSEELPQMPSHLETFWKQSPGLVPPKKEAYLPGLSIGKEKQTVKLTKLQQGELGWNKGKVSIFSKMPIPGITFGIIFTIIGVSACITVVTRFEIPGMGFILKNIPASLAFSLSLVRGGLHAIFDSLKVARTNNRYRQEANQAYQLFRMRESLDILTEAERRKESLNVYMLNEQLFSQHSLVDKKQAHDIYGKKTSDLPHELSSDCMKDIQKALDSFEEKPSLVSPTTSASVPPLEGKREVNLSKLEAALPKMKALSKSCSKKFFDFFYKRQETLGYIDLAVGQITGLAALLGIAAMCIPGLDISGFEMLVHDPSMSIPFYCILLVHWINCTRTGWRMLDYDAREKKRAKIETELRSINLRIERCRLLAYAKWIKEKLDQISKTNPEKQAFVEKTKHSIDLALANFETRHTLILSKFGPSLKSEKSHKKEKTAIHRFCDRAVPFLATPSILIGFILLLISLTGIGVTIGGVIPPSFELLVKNTSLSIIFSATLFALGTEMIYRGISLSDHRDKKKQKIAYSEMRTNLLFKLNDPREQQKCIDHFLNNKPQLVTPKKESKENKVYPQEVVIKSSETQRKTSKKYSEKLATYQERLNHRKGWYGFWAKSLHHPALLIPKGAAGIFLLFVSISGLILVASGSTPPEFLDFIMKEPSASATFFFGLLAIGISTLSNFNRSLKYSERKKEDSQEVNMIKRCYETLFPKPPLTLAHKV